MPRTLRLAVVLVSLLSATFVLKASLPQVSSGTWQVAGNLGTARAGGAAVALPDGRVLITGGADVAGAPVASAELFNTDGTFSSAAPMNAARIGHAAIVLPDGRVLVTGGRTSGGGITNSAETYDPQANAWQTLPSTMVEARAGQSMSQLLNGDVLLAGGASSSGPVSALEIFDETNDSFSSAGALASARQDHAAAVLSDGRVLLAGGTGVDASGNPTALSSTEIYDPSAGLVSAGPAMSTARAKLSATTLLDGTVALIGGNDGSNDLASVEVYDSAAGSISVSPATLGTPRSGHLAFLLPHNNSVLVVGGTSAATELASAELFVPWNNAVQATDAMTSARAGAAGAPLSTVDGLLLVAGGQNAGLGTLAGAELYGFATVKTDQSDYAPGTTVNITGSGWQPGETVSLTLVESPNLDTHPAMTAVADQDGNISNSQFSPDSHDLNVRFYLTAVGSQSQAQTTFTDAIGTNTAVSSSQNPSSVGQNVTFTATVTETSQGGGNPGAPVTAGTVDFRLGGNNCNQGQGTVFASGVSLNGSGQASASNTFASAGSFTIRACYNGVSGTGSSNGTITQTVNAVTVSTTNSTVTANPASVTANGISTSTVTVTLKDSNSNPVSGKAVSLTAGSGSSTVTTVSGTTNSSGQATFSVKDSVAESVTYTGTDTTDNITVTQTATVTFTAGSVSAGTSTVVANPTSVTADGTSTSTITVTLKDANNNPVSGKTVALSQGIGSSTISAAGGPSNSSGVVTFTVKDTKAETVTYSAADTADSIAITQTAAVTFTPGPATKFVVSAPATADLGVAFSFTVTAQDANNNTASGYSGTVHFTSSDAQAVLPANSGLTSGTGTFSATLKTAGNQTITGTDTVAASITGTSNNVNVNKADQTITFNTLPSKTYGDGDFSVAASASAGLSVLFASQTTSVCSVSGSNVHIIAAGTCTVRASQPGDSNYNPAPNVDQSFTVAQKAVTASIVASSKTYDGTTSATITSCTVSPVIGGDDVACSASGASFASKNVANAINVTATVALTGATAPNYTLNGNNTATAPANINPAHLTVTADSKTMTYGDPIPALTAAVTGFVNGESLGTSGVSGAASCSITVSTPLVTGSPYTITCIQGSLTAANYDFPAGNFHTGQLTVTPAHLTVTADNKTMTYGDPIPALTATVTGFVNGELLGTSGVSGAASCSISASTPLVTGSPYTITCIQGSLTAANYDFPAGNFHTGQLTVTPKPVTASIVASSKTYDGTTSATITSCTVSPAIGGDDVACSASGASFASKNVANAINVTATVALTGATAPNYTLNGNTIATTTANISAAPLLITASSGTKSYGQSFTVTPQYNGFVNGETDAVLSAQPICSSPGTAITATVAGSPYLTSCSGGAAMNYAISYVGGILNVIQANSSTTLATSSNPSLLNAAVTFTATVTDATPNSTGTPTGAVKFYDGATLIGTSTLNGNVATLQVSNLAVNVHSITAVYSGDSNFNGSTSSVLSQTVQYASTGVCYGDAGHQILQPINADGSSTFKQGSTVPAKFRVCDALGNSIGTPGVVSSFNLVGVVSGTITANVDETVLSTTPDTAFRWDPTAQQWIFNISTKNLSTHTTYIYRISLNDGSSILFQYGLPK